MVFAGNDDAFLYRLYAVARGFAVVDGVYLCHDFALGVEITRDIFAFFIVKSPRKTFLHEIYLSVKLPAAAYFAAFFVKFSDTLFFKKSLNRLVNRHMLTEII